MMEDPEEQIERVLNSLRDAQPRGGADALKRRFLAKLPQDQTPVSAFDWKLWRHAGIAAASTACFLAFALMHQRSGVAPREGAFASTPIRHTLLNENRSTLLQQKSMHPARRSKEPAPQLTEMPAVSGKSDSEQALLEDFYAPSRPAPPMPLSRDEKLLLRAARHVDQVEIAQVEALPRPFHTADAVEQYVHHMLLPVVMAEKLSPTPKPESEAAPALSEAPDSVQPIQ